MCRCLDGERRLLIAIIPVQLGVIVAIRDRAARTAEREVIARIDARAVHVEGLAASGVVAVNARAAPRLADAAPGVRCVCGQNEPIPIGQHDSKRAGV